MCNISNLRIQPGNHKAKRASLLQQFLTNVVICSCGDLYHFLSFLVTKLLQVWVPRWVFLPPPSQLHPPELFWRNVCSSWRVYWRARTKNVPENSELFNKSIQPWRYNVNVILSICIAILYEPTFGVR